MYSGVETEVAITVGLVSSVGNADCAELVLPRLSRRLSLFLSLGVSIENSILFLRLWLLVRVVSSYCRCCKETCSFPLVFMQGSEYDACCCSPIYFRVVLMLMVFARPVFLVADVFLLPVELLRLKSMCEPFRNVTGRLALLT